VIRINYINSAKIFKHSMVLPDKPITVEIHLCGTKICTNKCFYCSFSDKKQGTIMSKKDINYSLKFLKQLGVKGLVFSGGGEPLLSPDFANAIVLAKSYGMSVGVITNGTELKENINKIILENCTWIRVSFDAINKEQYKKIRGVDLFEKTKNNIKQLIKDKIKYESICTIGIQNVVNKYNYKTVKEFAEFCKTTFNGIDYVQIRPIETKIKEKPYNIVQERNIKKQLSEMKSKNTELDFTQIIISDKWGTVFSKDREFGFEKCYCFNVIGTVTSDCNFYLCCHTVDNPKYCFGNIKEMNTKKFFIERKKKIKLLGTTLGLNPNVCPISCRGSGTNRSIQGVLVKGEHDNFL
jgi:GTP 3',8-cyclase